MERMVHTDKIYHEMVRRGMDLTFRPVDENGRFTAEFAAYTKLVVVNRVQSQVEKDSRNKDSMTFDQFMKAIQENHIVNDKYDRPVSSQEMRNNQIYMQYNGGDSFARQRFDTIARAYELGLVDENGVLISSSEMEG